MPSSKSDDSQTPEARRKALQERPSLHATMAHAIDGSKQPGALYLDSEILVEFSSLSQILSQYEIGPAIAWGDFAMSYYGIPTVCRNYHLLIPDSRLEEAHKILKAAGYVDEPFFAANWNEFDVPNFQINSPASNENGITFFIQGLSICKPTFDAIDLKRFSQMSGIAIPPLQLLGQSFLNTLTIAPDPDSLLHLLLRAWCSYVRSTGFTPLGKEAMNGVGGINQRAATFWETSVWSE